MTQVSPTRHSSAPEALNPEPAKRLTPPAGERFWFLFPLVVGLLMWAVLIALYLWLTR